MSVAISNRRISQKYIGKAPKKIVIRATGGDLVATSGSYRLHVFKSTGKFQVNWVDPSYTTNPITFVLYGGGAGGGNGANGSGGNGGNGGNGGGAGFYGDGVIDAASAYSGGLANVIVGAGGAVNSDSGSYSAWTGSINLFSISDAYIRTSWNGAISTQLARSGGLSFPGGNGGGSNQNGTNGGGGDATPGIPPVGTYYGSAALVAINRVLARTGSYYCVTGYSGGGGGGTGGTEESGFTEPTVGGAGYTSSYNGMFSGYGGDGGGVPSQANGKNGSNAGGGNALPNTGDGGAGGGGGGGGNVNGNGGTGTAGGSGLVAFFYQFEV